MPLSLPRRRRFSLTRHKYALWALPAFGALLIAAVWLGTWLQLQSTENALLAAAMRDTQSFVGAFERYTQRKLKDTDRMTRFVKEEFEHYGAIDMARLVRAGVIEGTGAVQVSVVDPQGDVVASSQPLRAVNVADRAYFRLHAKQDTGQLDISVPVVGRSSGRSLIQMSRRINYADGTFAGLVLVSVTPDYFTDFYEEADLGKLGSIGLLGLDGVFRGRRVGTEATSSSDGSGTQLVRRAVADPVGQFEARGEFDQVPRIVAYRKLAEFPFIVTVGQATEEALGDFYRNQTNYLVIATIATIVLLVFFGVVTVLAVRLQKNRAALKVQRQFLETLVDNVPSGITVRSMRPDTFGQYVLWNESNAIIVGIKADDVLGKTVAAIKGNDYAAKIAQLDEELLASPMVQNVILPCELPSGKTVALHLVRAPIFGADGRVEYIMATATDITEDLARTNELRLASKVFETTADGIMISDSDDRVIMINPAFTKLTGYGESDVVGVILAETPFRPIDRVEADARMETMRRDGYMTGEVARFRKDGTPLALWLTASVVRNQDGTLRNYVRVYTDISLLKQAQRKLEQLASFDTLTGLPNRRLLHDRLEQALLRAGRHRASMALMFIDLDGFKEVNDTLGHDVGDLLLREVAQRLSTCIRASDTIGRFGGDEFAVVLEDASLPADAILVGERIVAALDLPFDLNGHRVRTAASIGIAIYPPDGTDATTLLKHADVAMYKAKRNGRNRFEFFSKVDEPDTVD